MDCSTPGFPVHHHLLELTQTHVHWVSDAIQPSRPLVLELQLQHHSVQWILIFLDWLVWSPCCPRACLTIILWADPFIILPTAYQTQQAGLGDMRVNKTQSFPQKPDNLTQGESSIDWKIYNLGALASLGQWAPTDYVTLYKLSDLSGLSLPIFRMGRQILHRVEMYLFAQSCLTLCDPLDCSLSDSSVHRFPRQEPWSGLLFPPLGDLLDPGIELVSPVSPPLQVDSLPAEPLGKPFIG